MVLIVDSFDISPIHRPLHGGNGAVPGFQHDIDGMCRRCTEEYHLAQERAFNEQLERERAHAEDAADIGDVRRERDKMRQRNSRLCRKYGLKGKRERKR